MDIDGQARDGSPDVGADEVSRKPILNRPLTKADVGPFAKNAPSPYIGYFSRFRKKIVAEMDILNAAGHAPLISYGFCCGDNIMSLGTCLDSSRLSIYG